MRVTTEQLGGALPTAMTACRQCFYSNERDFVHKKGREIHKIFHRAVIGPHRARQPHPRRSIWVRRGLRFGVLCPIVLLHVVLPLVPAKRDPPARVEKGTDYGTPEGPGATRDENRSIGHGGVARYPPE